MRLLPFPWIFATRNLARRLVEHIEVCHQTIDRQQLEILKLQSELNEHRAGGVPHG